MLKVEIGRPSLKVCTVRKVKTSLLKSKIETGRLKLKVKIDRIRPKGCNRQKSVRAQILIFILIVTYLSNNIF